MCMFEYVCKTLELQNLIKPPLSGDGRRLPMRVVLLAQAAVRGSVCKSPFPFPPPLSPLFPTFRSPPCSSLFLLPSISHCIPPFPIPVLPNHHVSRRALIDNYATYSTALLQA
jgi:hypothetical protein